MANDIPAANLQSWLDKLVALVQKPKLAEVIQQWLTHLAGELGKGFLQSRGPDGQTWPALKQRRPKGHNQGHRPLIDFGDLLASVASDGNGHVEIVGDDSAEFGTNLDYAGIHQDGGGRIPARPFVGVSDEMADLVTDMVADELMKQIGGLQ